MTTSALPESWASQDDSDEAGDRVWRQARGRAAKAARRRHAVELIEGGTSQAVIARRFGVSREAVRQWWDAWCAGGASAAVGRPAIQPRVRAIQQKGATTPTTPTETVIRLCESVPALAFAICSAVAHVNGDVENHV